jgi:hypothetical protein
MPRKPTKHDDPEQSKRFLETAEEVGAYDDGALERAFKKIITKPPSPHRQKSRSGGVSAHKTDKR